MEKSSDAGKKPPGKPSVRSVWVKAVKKPQDEQPIVTTPPLTPSLLDVPETEIVEIVQAIKKPQVVRSIWVVSAKKSPVGNSKPINNSHNEEPGVSVGSLRKLPESSEPVHNAVRSVPVGSAGKSDLPEPVVKSQSKKSMASSSPLVRSVWVEKSLELPGPLPIEFAEEIEVEQLTPSPLPSTRSVRGESEDTSSELPKTVPKKKNKLPVYPIPEHLKLQMDVVPDVLFEPLSLSTYADYFATLLYAEDFYIEKWSNFLLYRVTLELDEKRMAERKEKNVINNAQKNEKIYVLFEITSIPEKRPYLLSRDFVFVRRSGKKSNHFEGRVVRVVKSTRVLTEFGDDFRAQYSPLNKYDVSFSFNRTCLKRSHQAVEAALVDSFQNILFPICPPRTTLISPDPATLSNEDFDHDQISTIHKILSLRGPPPYLIKGPLALSPKKILSRVGVTILEVILQIYRNNPICRILVCAPKNRTCDLLISSLNKVIPESDLFRANAAFREIDDVPGDILPLCSYDGECFSDPSLPDLWSFKVIASTFMTSFRLHASGIPAGHFTHIFMVDASSATEPETMVALANLVGDETAVVLTGSLRNYPDRVRSDISRKHGLKRSYFHRLLESEPYSSHDPACVSVLG